MKVFYFLGTAPHHINHAMEVYRELGGEFIVMSQEGVEVCRSKGVEYRLTEEHPFAQHYEISKSQATINYLNDQSGILFVYQPANILKEFTSLKKIFVFHGNDYNSWWIRDKGSRISYCDYVTSMGPIQEGFLRNVGVDEKKFIQIGQPRNDQIIKYSGKVEKQELIFKEMGLNNKKIVSYMPTWWIGYTIFDLGKEIVKNISSDYILIFRPHPDTPKELMMEYKKLIKQKTNVLYISEYRFNEIDFSTLLNLTDLFILDMSGILANVILSDKPIIFAMGGPNPSKPESYKTVKEIFENSNKIEKNNIDQINSIIQKSLDDGIDQKIWEESKKKLWFNLEGNATQKLVEFARSLLE